MPPAPLMQPPMGSAGPASPPTGNPGMAADSMSKMREAIKLIEMALPGLPPGSEGHKNVIDALGKLSKSFPATDEVPGVQNTQLKNLAEQAQKTAMLQAVLRQGQGGATPPPPGAAPGGPPPAEMQGAA